MAGEKQKGSVSIGRIKVIEKTKPLTYIQKVGIVRFMDQVLSAVILGIRQKKGEPEKKFDIRMGSTIRRLRKEVNDLMDSPVPVDTRSGGKYVKDFIKNISVILTDAGIPKNQRKDLLLQTEGALLQVLFMMDETGGRKLPVSIKRTEPVEI